MIPVPEPSCGLQDVLVELRSVSVLIIVADTGFEPVYQKLVVSDVLTLYKV